MRRLHVLVVAGVALAGSYLTFAASETVKVEGGLISGREANGLRIFQGIPFAAPPIGNLRWKEPQPVTAWNGVKSADAPGAVCEQTPSASDSVYYMAIDKMSEDCLFLNVWTTAKAGGKLPVMVYFHGGGLTRGAGSNPRHNATALAKKGVIVVTVNYRMGPLGYLAHPELTAESSHHSSGNYGTLDQIAALKWVQKNIAAFGGDPGQVTIFGQSAGSWSVNTLVASPLAKGLFGRAIGMSGARFHRGTYVSGDRSLAAREKVGVAFAMAAGADSLKALRAVPVEKLLSVPNFRTVENVDGWVLPVDIRQIFAEHKQNKVPVMIGSTANEMTTITSPASLPKTLAEYRKWIETQYGEMAKQFETLYPVKTESDIADAILNSTRDAGWTLEMRTWARMQVAAGSKAYLYQWSYAVPNPKPGLGAYHGSEIEYVFSNFWLPWKYTDVDRRVAEYASSYWSNFAKTGDPNGQGLPKWTPYNLADEPYMDLGAAPRLRNHLAKPQLDFLERVADGRVSGRTSTRQ